MPDTNLDLIRGRQVVLPLTNKSGAERVEGAVVIVEIYTDDAFTTGTASGDDLALGVVAETIANNAEGRVICGGYAPVVEVDGATVRGNYLKTSATAGEATPTATFDVGVFAIALSAVGGAGQVSAYLFGVDGSVGAGVAWTLIEDIELGAPAATIDFLAIPGTYKHLMILFSVRSDRAAEDIDGMILRLNNSAVGYDWLRWEDPGGGNEGINDTEIDASRIPAINSPAGSFSGGEIWIHDYLDTNKMTSVTVHTGLIRLHVATNLHVNETYGQWRTTSAITRVTLISLTASNFIADSRATLYGIN